MDRLPNTGFIDFTGYCNDLRLVLGGAGAVPQIRINVIGYLTP